MSAALKHGLERAHALMGRVLRGGASIAEEYPLVFRDGFSGRVVTLGREGDVRSACAILDRPLLCGDERLRVGLIGSVSTAPEHRHQGLATRVLQQAERELRERGCLFSLLWADDPRFYFARGYRPVGSELDFTLDADAIERIRPFPVRPAAPADAAAIHGLYEQHDRRVARTLEETAALLECPGMKTLVVERRGEVCAYGCLGRGDDLFGTVHEWGGPPEQVLGIVRAHFGAWTARTGNGRLFLMSSPEKRLLRDRLVRLGAESSHGILGLGKLLDRRAGGELLAARLGPGSRVEYDAASDPRDLAPAAGGPAPEPTVRLVGPRGTEALDDGTLLALLFPSRGNNAEHEALAERLGVVFATPARSPYVWGLDSI